MAEGDQPPLGGERHLRPVEPGDPALIRRAREAEASVRTLEGHVAELRRSLREAEEEQRHSAEQLAQREHEVRRVKQREYAEQQLRVEAEEQRERLEREQRSELDRLRQRLGTGERHARELSERLEVLRRELSEAEQAAVTGRAATRRAEHALAEREADLARRELELKQQLEGVRRSHVKMMAILGELKALVGQLGSARAQVVSAAVAQPVPDEPAREDMANALAAAVARLRARAAAPTEPEEQPAVKQGSEEQPAVEQEPEPTSEPVPTPTPFDPRVLALSAQRESWLAPAIRRVAERRDAKLAAELICELLPAQRVKRPLGYTLRIAGLDDVQVRVEGERATVRRPSEGRGTAVSRGDFLLEGSAAAFAELAAGGAGRRLSGVKAHGSRRKLRRLLASRRAPLALSDLAEADIRVWPGLLLLALSEAIDPAWTVGHSFVLAFVIQSPPAPPSATLYVQVRGGEPIAVTRVRSESPLCTVKLSEQGCLCMLAGAPLPPGEEVLLEGPREPLELLLGWSDKAQRTAS